MLTHKSKNHQNMAGFTLVEIIMSMAIFSFVLLVVSTGFLHVTKIYRSTLAARATQENARNVVDQITRYARDAHTMRLLSGGGMCLAGNANTRFRVDGDERLIMEQLAGSDCDSSAVISQQTITSDNVIVPEFEVTAPGMAVDHQSFRLRVVVATKTLDLLDDSGGSVVCEPDAAGAEFCSTTETVSLVTLREPRKGEI